jgi:succinyl-diaminopimelate desuccinylase
VTDNSYAKFVDEYLYNDYLGEKFNVAFTGEMGALTVNLGILNYENNEGSLTLDLRLPHDSDNDELVKNVDEAVNKGLYNVIGEDIDECYMAELKKQ